MYQMYPEWGPARHRHDEPETMSTPTRRPRYWERELVGATAGASTGAGTRGATGARDADGERPDDN